MVNNIENVVTFDKGHGQTHTLMKCTPYIMRHGFLIIYNSNFILLDNIELLDILHFALDIDIR